MSGSLVIQDSSEISVTHGSVSIFVLFRPPANCMTPPTLGRATFFTLSTDSSRNTLIDTPRIMFNQISGHPMAQSSGYITVAITPYDLKLSKGNCHHDCIVMKMTHSAPQNAAAAAKLLQSCLILCDPINSTPPGSPVPGILQARTLEWVAISFSNAGKWKVKVKSLSRVRLLTPWTAAYQASPSMGFSRQEYWSGLPLPSLLKMLWFLNVITSQSEAHASQVCRHICSIYQWHWIRHFLKPSWRYSESYCINHVFNFCILWLFDIWGLY